MRPNILEVIVSCTSCGDNSSAATYDPCSGSQLRTYKHAGTLGHHSLQLLSDSYLIASSSSKKCLHLWPLNSQTPVPNLRLTTPGNVSALACTPSGSYIAAAMGNQINVWQTCTGALVSCFKRHYQDVSCLVFNADGSYLASGGEDNLVIVWSLSQLVNEEVPKEICLFDCHRMPIKDLYFGKVGSFGRLYSVSVDRSARIFDVNSKQLLLTLIFDTPLTTITLDFMENSLFVGSSTGTIQKCSLREPPMGNTERYVQNSNNSVFKGHQGSITALSVSSDCITLLSGSSDSSVKLWDIASCQMILNIQHKAPVTSAFFATAFSNFEAKTLTPSIKVKPLERVSTKTSNELTLEVCTKNDDSWLLNFDNVAKRLVNVVDSGSSDKGDELEELRRENDKLKKINADLYEFSMKKIIKN